jgi:TROVE domain
MSKFNRLQTRPSATSPVQTLPGNATTVTYNGAPAWKRDEKSELFMLGVTNFVGEETFYESAADRDERFARLVASVAVSDPEWLGRFLPWLRREGCLRSAPLVAALTAAKTMVDNKIPGSRSIVNSVLRRADEPGEAVAAWMSMFGRSMPKPVKRGIADAARRLYTEYSASKYDTDSHVVRFGDVLNLTHPAPHDAHQGVLFEYLLDSRHGDGARVPEVLRTLTGRQRLLSMPLEERRGALLADQSILDGTAMTWEKVAGWLQSPLDAEVWKALIPVMGIMARARNLRNFDEAGVSDSAVAPILDAFSDWRVVEKSRLMPFEWLKAYMHAPSTRWSYPLELAAKASLANVPELTGRTLVLIDTSGSMTQSYSSRSTVPVMASAALFGLALASKAGPDVEVHGFATGHFPFPLAKGCSLLPNVVKFVGKSNAVGWETNGFTALKNTYRNHDRVVIITDMQFDQFQDQSRVVASRDTCQCRSYRCRCHQPTIRELTWNTKKNKATPVYFFNTNGYRQSVSQVGSEGIHELGGVTDATFKMIPWIEQGHNAVWPF